MATATGGLTDEQKKEWVDRCVAEPGFQAALVVETYITVKAMMVLAEAVGAKMGGLVNNPMVAAMLGGNGKEG